MVRQEVELVVTAGDIPERLVVDLTGTEVNDTHPHLEHRAAGRHPADHLGPRFRDRQHPGALGPEIRDEGEGGSRRSEE